MQNTFVPERNILFTLAGALAHRRGLRHLITGVCETDDSGYHDCRDDIVKALQVTLNLGMATQLIIHTPLMWTDKAGTWAMARNLGSDALVELIRWESHTCYTGDRARGWDWGYGCGSCPACRPRSDGWRAYSDSGEAA